MKLLYAPWRSNYTNNTTRTKNEEAATHECTFCKLLAQPQENDAKNFIIKRFSHTAVMLNLYPYNAGHLLVIPIEHYAHLHHLAQHIRAQLMELMTHSIQIVTQALNAQGVNSGTNLGKSAGAGIPSHVHIHVLPRWDGDTNFLPTLADTKPISRDLLEIYRILHSYFNSITI